MSLTVPADGQIRADATSNATLPTAAHLGRSAVGKLVALGWQPPGVLDGAGQRFGLQTDVDDPDGLATIVARTMRDVYGAPHPAFLTYDYQTEDESVADLVLAPARPVTPGEDDDSDPGRTPVSGPLGEVVATVVAAMQHTTPAHLAIDTEGEISLRAGSAMVFIKPTERPRSGRRVLTVVDGRGDQRTVVQRTVRIDTAAADRAAVLRRLHHLGFGSRVRTRLPAIASDVGGSIHDSVGRRSGRPPAAKIRRASVLRREDDRSRRRRRHAPDGYVPVKKPPAVLLRGARVTSHGAVEHAFACRPVTRTRVQTPLFRMPTVSGPS